MDTGLVIIIVFFAFAVGAVVGFIIATLLAAPYKFHDGQ